MIRFKELTEGKYPLALPEDDDKKPAIPKKEIKRAAKELAEMDILESTGKPRKSKKQRKRDAMKALAMNTTVDSVGSEDGSEYIQDEDLLDHVSDNYLSYLDDEIDKKSSDEPAGDEIDGPETEHVEIEAPVKKKKKVKAEKSPKEGKGKKRKWKTEVEVEADEVVEADAPVEDQVSEKLQANEIECSEEVIVLKRPKLNKRASLGGTPSASTPVRGKARRLSELRTPTNKASLMNNSMTNSASKRVSFVLARNREHGMYLLLRFMLVFIKTLIFNESFFKSFSEHADYPVSIARSPAIPYDKQKQPSTKGLLKSPGNTPKSTPIRRAAALEFF